MEASDDHDALLEQRAYYAARARAYDDSYRRVGKYDRGTEANASWQSEMRALTDAFDRVPISGEVVELAAGTGFWTERLVHRAASLVAIDANIETLAVNRERLGPDAARVDYRNTDLFEWQPDRAWDACVFCFWICHVPDQRIPDFLNRVHAALRPGGVVCFVDKATASDPETERVERTIEDGRVFSLIDHARPPERLVEMFATAGFEITVDTIGTRFCLGHGTRD